MTRLRIIGLMAVVAVVLTGYGTSTSGIVRAGSLVQRTAHDNLRTTLKCSVSPSPQSLLKYHPPKAKKRYKVTLMEVTLAGYYYQTIAYGATQAAKQAGVDLSVVSSGQGYATPSIQVQQAVNVLQKGTDAIVLAPSDIHGSVPVVNMANAKHVPVINISTEVASPGITMVMQDDYIMGKLGADEIHRLVPHGGQGIIIAGPANATWSRKRALGFQDEAKKYPNIKIVASPTQNVDPSLGLKSFDNTIVAHPNIKWIYTVFDFLLQPQSLPAKYRNVAFVTDGYDPTSRQALAGGRISSIAGITPYWMGYVGVGTAIAKLNGSKVPQINCIPIPIIKKSDIGKPVANHELSPPGWKAG